MTHTQFPSDRYGLKRPLRFLKMHARWQRNAPPATPLGKRLAMLRHGYSAGTYQLLGLPRADQAEFLPEIKRLETFFINGPFAREILNDKLLFDSLLQDKLPLPKTLALIERGKVYRVGDPQAVDIAALASEHGSVIIKPARSSHGHGVYQLTGEDGLEPSFKLSGRPVTRAEIGAFVSQLDNCLVSETAQQAAYAREICPGKVNSVRVLTCTDPDTHQPFVAHAFHRFGSADAAPIDNWSGGGLVTACSPETGVLGSSIRNPKRTGGVVQRFSHHPDTGRQIEGVQIPYWDEMCRSLLDAVRALPLLVYVGWDVAITDQGFLVLEGNNNTDVIMQMHGGLLQNPRLRRFYEYHNVV